MQVKERNSVVPLNIVNIINDRGLKQCAIADKSGLTRQQFNAMLNGRRVIRPCDISAIAEVLGVSPNVLFEKAEQAQAKTISQTK